MQAIEFETMGCHARAFIASNGLAARRALDRLPDWFGERERTLSRFDPESALGRLNRSGHRRNVEEVLWLAVDIALRVSVETGGLVTPTILRALEDSGYDRSFDAVRRDQAKPPARGLPAPDSRAVARDRATRTIRLQPGVSLDLGGTAKAWSLDEAAEMLAQFGPVLVDVGGDIAMRGKTTSPWPIAVRDPHGGESIDLLLVPRGGVATSGRDHRRWYRAGKEQHHLIDPRTGEPARTDVLAATVIGRTALDADVAAKRLLLEGSAAGIRWIESTLDLAAIIVTDDRRVLRTRRVAATRWRETG